MSPKSLISILRHISNKLTEPQKWPKPNQVINLLDSETSSYCKVINYFYLSHDVSVIQSIMSCHKQCYDHTLRNTFGGTELRHDDFHYNSANFHGNKKL